MDKIEVGQKLFYVTHLNRRNTAGYYVTVTKIGRRWIQTNHQDLRLDKNTLLADGVAYTSPGKAYLTYEEYAEIREVEKLWKDILEIVRDYRKPKHSSKRLRDILTLLKDTDE